MVRQIRPFASFTPPARLENTVETALFIQKHVDELQGVIDKANLVLRELRDHKHVEADITDLSHVIDIDGTTALSGALDIDADYAIVYDDSATANRKVSIKELLFGERQTLTADTGSAQGGSPITASLVYISACATAGDSVTLPSGARGFVIIYNAGAESADIFPASLDSINAGADDAAEALASGAGCICWKHEDTTWRKVDI